MSTNNFSRDFRRDIEQIAKEASATVAYERSGGDHIRVWLHRNGSRRLVITSSTSANFFREQNILGDVRRELRKLGYVPPTRAKHTERERPWRNRPQRQRQRIERVTPAPGRRLRKKYGSEINAMTATLRTVWKGQPS